MKITCAEFHNKLIDPSGNLKSYTTLSEKIGEVNLDFGTLLEYGAVQVTDKDTLAGSYCLTDGTFWGTYEMRDYSSCPELPTVDQLWADQIKRELGIFEDNEKISFLQNASARRMEYFYNGVERKDCILMLLYKNLQNKNLVPLEYLRATADYQCCESKEYPFKIYIAGDDDCSFSKVFLSFEDMSGWFNWCCSQPRDYRWFTINMIYTN